MVGSRRMILGHVMAELAAKMGRTKKLEQGADLLETPLRRCLNTWDLTLLGIGHMVGAGVYVLMGTVAREVAGPGIVLSFLVAGITSLLAALCYAEFGARVPKAGSAYVYSYVCVGEFWAFVIGWNIVLEHMIGAASVARAWSGYVDSLAGGVISNVTDSVLAPVHNSPLAPKLDPLAAVVCLVYAALLAVGVKASSVLNSALTAVNMSIMLLVIVLGFIWAPGFDNWTIPGAGFLPFGPRGILVGAAACFYAFVGFDSIATAGEEAKDPGRSIPIATLVSMGVVMMGYMFVGAALTLLVPYSSIVPEAALPAALASVGLGWARYIVAVGALCGMTTTLFGSLFSLPRCLYAMAMDGLLFPCFARVNPRTQLPLINLTVAGVCSALIALVLDLEKLVEFMSIGTLMAYTIVSAGVIVLRYRPELPHQDSTCKKSDEEATEKSLEDQSGPRVGEIRLANHFPYRLLASCKPGRAVSVAVAVYCALCVILALHIQIAHELAQRSVSWADCWGATAVDVVICTGLAICLVVIYAHVPSDARQLRFRVPLVPFVPALSILCNLLLMVHLNLLTWLRFLAWMTLGLLVYFFYGLQHSKQSITPSSSYSVLLGSAEAEKGPWGACKTGAPPASKPSGNKAAISSDDRTPIVDQEEIPE